jgi:crossover junction endodeoxyribonuclease RuvC
MGVDPGVSGAVAIIDIGLEVPKVVALFDMPTVTIKVGKKNRQRIDVLSLALKIDAFSPMLHAAIIEEVGQVGTDADPFSSFVFGFATGVVHGVLNTCMVPTQTVKPHIWKLSIGVSSDKSTSIAKAHRLFPESKEHITLKKHDGRAEALLLAWYGWKHLPREVA